MNLPKLAKEEEDIIKQSIKFNQGFLEFNKWRLEQLYKRYSPQLDLFEGES